MLHRHFIVTVWDSKTGESVDSEVVLNLPLDASPPALASAIHTALVTAEGGDDPWIPTVGHASPMQPGECNLATVWVAPDGTLSTESSREVTLTRVQAECKNLVPN